MKKLYDNKPVLFALLFILLYCAITIPVRGEYGDGSLQSLLSLSAVAAVIIVISSFNRLWIRLGVFSKPLYVREQLYFIPMIILSTGNIWDGFKLSFTGAELYYAIGSMALVGFVEEMIFRAFLFRALLEKNRPKVAVIISAVTFGIGHIVNLLSGMATVENLLMIVFAIAWGFIFTMVYYKSGSLLLCITVHAVVDILSTVGAESTLGDIIYIFTVIVIGGAYSLYLSKYVETPEIYLSCHRDHDPDGMDNE